MDQTGDPPESRATAGEALDRTPWRGIALAELLWLMTIALLTLQRAGYWAMMGRGIPRNIVFLEASVGLTWGLMLPVIAYFSLRRPLVGGRRGWGTHAALFAAAAGLEAVVYAAIDTHLLHVMPWRAGAGFLERVRNTVAGHWMASVQFFGMIVGVTQAHVWRRLFEQRRLRSARLETELARSQLQALRSEIHPHFLFNALQAVSTLMHRDVAAADTMLARLGDLLRASLAGGDVHEVALSEELTLLGHYLDIERTRFGERLEVRIDAAGDALVAFVPRLLLQPLVENALRHGIAPRRGPGRVVVRARLRGSTLRIQVVDDGLGSSAAGRGGAGIGLANTRRRLAGLYGSGHRFYAAPSARGGFRVSIQLPFHTRPLDVEAA